MSKRHTLYVILLNSSSSKWPLKWDDPYLGCVLIQVSLEVNFANLLLFLSNQQVWWSLVILVTFQTGLETMWNRASCAIDSLSDVTSLSPTKLPQFRHIDYLVNICKFRDNVWFMFMSLFRLRSGPSAFWRPPPPYSVNRIPCRHSTSGEHHQWQRRQQWGRTNSPSPPPPRMCVPQLWVRGRYQRLMWSHPNWMGSPKANRWPR